jgi:DNA-binding response OmpR family regulator
MAELILVIEDEEPVQEAIVPPWRRPGYKVITAQ